MDHTYTGLESYIALPFQTASNSIPGKSRELAALEEDDLDFVDLLCSSPSSASYSSSGLYTPLSSSQFSSGSSSSDCSTSVAIGNKAMRSKLQAQLAILMEEKPDIPLKASYDRAIVEDERVLHNMLSKEKAHIPYQLMSAFKDVQTEVKSHMRRELANWMLTVSIRNNPFLSHILNCFQSLDMRRVGL